MKRDTFNEQVIRTFNVPANQQGQMAIFIAMIFQVLFVFFAMVINIALTVHDKINLQNSVDLAAYYAAAKQAEMLNVMGHTNYQIRQSWKLLAFRYRVLGVMGIDRPGVAHPLLTGEKTETLYQPADKPAVCVTWKPVWQEVVGNENLCNRPNLAIPPLPQVSVIAGFLGINSQIAALSTQLRTQFQNQCARHGAFNWWWTASIMQAFRVDQAERKKTIFSLAGNLNREGNDFIDLDGGSVLAGAANTFRKNLTYENQRTISDVQIFNSLSGLQREQWIAEIQTAPTAVYVDVRPVDGCVASNRHIKNLPERGDARNFLLTQLGGNELRPWMEGEPPVSHIMHMSMGIEKNPWIMAYMGFKASTTPRQLFFPFGPGVIMSARAFAKPFGGSLGPWHQSNWASGASRSSGIKVDFMGPSRTKANGLLDSPDDPSRLPNYGRYPGDPWGLRSKLSQASLVGLRNTANRFQYYKNIRAGYFPTHTNDHLAWNYNNNTAPRIRLYEIAAVIPDLFDVTYYSIAPNFSVNYYPRLRNSKAAIGIPANVVLRPDIGFAQGIINSYSVQQQLEAVALPENFIDPVDFYRVRDKANYLTSWAPNEGAVNYTFPQSRFGKCTLADNSVIPKNPGSCIAGGGRTGYSTKLISRDALNSSAHQIGGPSSPPGPILNRPPNEF